MQDRLALFRFNHQEIPRLSGDAPADMTCNRKLSHAVLYYFSIDSSTEQDEGNEISTRILPGHQIGCTYQPRDGHA
jgi:hypothetical protein